MEYYFFWNKAKKENYVLWKKRMYFLRNNKIEILVNLLESDDYFTGVGISKAKAYISLYEWLKQLPQTDKEYDELNIPEWLKSIEGYYQKSIKMFPNQKSSTNNKRSVSIAEIFYQLFKEEDDAKKKKKFEKLLHILEEAELISNRDSDGKYEWARGKSGRCSLLAALCRVLNRDHFGKELLDSKNHSYLLGSWIQIDDGIKSIGKKLQPNQQEELSKKYLKEIETVLKIL